MRIFHVLSAIALVCASFASHAGTWNSSAFSTGGANSASSSTANTANSGVTATISAYSNAPTASANLTNTSSILTAAGSGLGVQKTGLNPSDAAGMDNVSGIDGILIQFSTAQVLSSFSVAQSSSATASSSGCGGATSPVCGTDSDVSLLVWTGSGAPVLASGLSATSTLTTGWKLVGNYANAGASASVATGWTGQSSSYWLLTAYNSAWGTGQNLDAGNDCVDVLGFATGTSGGTPGRMPEPASMALVSLALLGMGAARRKARSA